MALGLDALAWTAAADDPQRSARLLGAADALRSTMGTTIFTLPGLADQRTT